MVLQGFHPAVRAWFEQTFGQPTPAQQRAWPAIRSGGDVLVAAPTGSGKTLAAFLAVIDELVRRRLAGEPSRGVEVVYVSPLKALSTDVHLNLDAPLAGVRAALARGSVPGVELRAGLRTGDTPAKVRVAMARAPPDILVTTPESLYVLLTAESGRRALAGARVVIVDEIHAVAGNKRGAHLALSLERLEALAGRPLQRIGLSATQRPLEEVARFLVGARRLAPDGAPCCEIVDVGHARVLDIGLELPSSPLAAVMPNEVWREVYERLCELIGAHRTTLVFVNTRRLAERVTRELEQRLGAGHVAAHHGSLSARLRQEAEQRLRSGALQALVATASLELGIDIGPVDLVCQIGSTRSIATLLQRVGRSGHRLLATPKGRLFPLTRDELVESAALLDAVGRGELDALAVPAAPLDIMAQQIVAEVACAPRTADELYGLVRAAYPYARLGRERFDAVVAMLTENAAIRHARRGALLHRDPLRGALRARQGARLVAITGGGAIPDNADYRVLREPTGTVLGSVNEDFAIESMAGDIFLLGNTSWQITKIEPGVVRVQDAAGQPPTIPFWLGEAPGRTRELSLAVSRLRASFDRALPDERAAAALASAIPGVPAAAAEQLVAYLGEAKRALGTLPTRERLIVERFFDESGGMQLVLHAPIGSRMNRAFGLALRKVFCRTFNFELQAAATEDAVVLSLGTRHSFPLGDVFRFLKARAVRQVLTQALLAAPMFQSRWRWNATRALVLPRARGGRKVPAQILRMQAEDLVAAVFPDQIACAENLAGERRVPDHPLVQQTVEDCLTEAMDVGGLEALLAALESGEVEGLARDLPEPSPLAHEILQARPYAFLDDAPLEERRTRAVYTRRALTAADARELGALDGRAIERVATETWPAAATADELHDALVQLGALGIAELEARRDWAPLVAELERAGRAVRLTLGTARVVAADERVAILLAVSGAGPARDPAAALDELVAHRLEVSRPLTAPALADLFGCDPSAVRAALARLEAEGFVLRGRFTPGEREEEWCERRVLARIHRLTIGRLRAEIEPVSLAAFIRFLAQWQRLTPETRVRGPEGLAAVLGQLDGFEAPAATWEGDLLAARVADYDPQWLDVLCLTGRAGWGRLRAPAGGGHGPLRTSPISLFLRESLAAHLGPAGSRERALGPAAARLRALLELRGASFYADLVQGTGLLPAQIEDGLGELVASGLVTADGFLGLRALLALGRGGHRGGAREGRRLRRVGLDAAGRWSLFGVAEGGQAEEPSWTAARVLLRRYGVVFRGLWAHDGTRVPWRELARAYRRLEARGEVRGGHFVDGPSGEQFALAEAVGLLRRARGEDDPGAALVVSAADPLNLVGTVLPGERVPATATNRVLFVGGEAVAALVAGTIVRIAHGAAPSGVDIEGALLGPRARRRGPGVTSSPRRVS